MYPSKRDNYQSHAIQYTKLKTAQNQQKTVAAVALSDAGLLFVSAACDKSQPGHKLYETGSYSSSEIISRSGSSKAEETENCSELLLLRCDVSPVSEAQNKNNAKKKKCYSDETYWSKFMLFWEVRERNRMA